MWIQKLRICWILLTFFSGQPQRRESAVPGNCPHTNRDWSENLLSQESWCWGWLWKMQVFNCIVTLLILFFLLFICRNSILLRARVQSAIQKKLLCFSHPILLLKLARDLDECSETKSDASLPSFFNWKWWMPSCTLPPRSNRTIIINSCRELDK